jgi:hypothetical protein
MKETAERDENPVKRSIAKLMLNALYGKTLQRAIFTSTIIVNNILEFNRFCQDNTLTDWSELGSGKLLITGESKNKTIQVKKPCQLGAFVTAYSRRIMLTYMKAVDPTLQSMVFTYTDTDSLHITGEAYFKLKQLGYIKDDGHSELGYLTSDIKKNGIIFYEINLAPKSYMYNYINIDGEIIDKDVAVMKMKGIPNKQLKQSYYENAKPEKIKLNGLKKKNKTLTKNDVANGVTHFSIINYEQERTFYKNEWQSERFIDNVWYPIGHEKLSQ